MFDYIERFYNPKRRHSTIGYMSPMEFETAGGISLGRCQPNRVQARSPRPSGRVTSKLRLVCPRTFVIRDPKNSFRTFSGCRRPLSGFAVTQPITERRLCWRSCRSATSARLTPAALSSRANQPNGFLLIDIWHLARGAIDYKEIGKIPQRFIGSIEVDDADKEVAGSLWDDTIFRRRLPGEGVLDVPAFLKAVLSAGYKGPWGVEILSETFRRLPLAEMAKRSFDATMNQFKTG